MRAVKVKYKQAVVGIGWALVQPVLAALVFALIFGRLAGCRRATRRHISCSRCGMTCWTYVNTATTTSQSLVTDQTLLRKVYFPREVVPFGSIGAALVDFAPAAVVLFVVAGLYGEFPALSWVTLPVLMVTLVVIAAAVSLVLGA